MAEGWSIDFDRLTIGLYKQFSDYGKCVTKDGIIYQFWRFYILFKNR